jgi:YD repeat-containing protein
LTAREASSQEWEYSYDANGNQTVEVDATGETGWWREHTRENRLAAVHRKVRGTTVSSVSYVYDAQGRRLMRTGPDGVKTRYYYDGLGVVLTKEKPVGGSWRTKHVYALKAAALGHIISERTMTAWNAQGTPTAWTDKWFHYDLLGNVTLETDANAQVTARVDMEAFGTVLTGGQARFRLRGVGFDPNADLYIVSTRAYSVKQGRHLERNSPYTAFGSNPVAVLSFGRTEVSINSALLDFLGGITGLQTYGNWCGKGHPPAGANPPTCSGMDECCKEHDKCYDTNRPRSECDSELCACIGGLKLADLSGCEGSSGLHEDGLKYWTYINNYYNCKCNQLPAE